MWRSNTAIRNHSLVFRYLRRNISSTTVRHGRSLENNAILLRPPPRHPTKVVVAEESKLTKSATYTQLPDDSQFITQHYDELRKFKKFLQSKSPPLTYKDFKQPNDLVLEVADFIENQLKTRKWEFDLPLDIELEYFTKFLHNLKIVLRLNGGYTFILDVLLQNKECFDMVEKKNKKK